MGGEANRRELLKAAAKRATETQPDEIHLSEAPAHAWSNAAAVETYATQTGKLGFVEAGTYTIDALPVAVRFLLKESERIYATIYEHPKAGVWMNFVILYENDQSSTYTTTPNRGLEQRPGHPIVHSPGAPAENLYALALRSARETSARKALTPTSIVAEFEKAWKEGVRWRKGRGISATEAASVLFSRQGRSARILRPDRIRFVADQDGPPERELKDALAAVFEQHQSVGRAYLAQVRYDEAPNAAVALCLVSATASDTALVNDIRKTFAARFQAGTELDILFVVAADVPRLERACRAFYTRERPPQ